VQIIAALKKPLDLNGILDDVDIMFMFFADPHGEMDPIGGGFAKAEAKAVFSEDYQKNAIKITYNGKETWVTAAVSESCIPEPATIALLAFGGLALLRKRK
jgi:hypothetical protein